MTKCRLRIHGPAQRAHVHKMFLVLLGTPVMGASLAAITHLAPAPLSNDEQGTGPSAFYTSH
jgi:hypothetical protein